MVKHPRFTKFKNPLRKTRDSRGIVIAVVKEGVIEELVTQPVVPIKEARLALHPEKEGICLEKKRR